MLWNVLCRSTGELCTHWKQVCYLCRQCLHCLSFKIMGLSKCSFFNSFRVDSGNLLQNLIQSSHYLDQVFEKFGWLGSLNVRFRQQVLASLPLAPKEHRLSTIWASILEKVKHHHAQMKVTGAYQKKRVFKFNFFRVFESVINCSVK